ncbi:hypothetical protein SLNWT_2390 [Streptomyces albus]|uniref:Uncharacterized protein n=1 Tax=Streptomyces albus (strain ATCC 21838 / DSM 41398 / FERM P-419 / JCM 4703 / NBRC 107858) TaxID=1081613 RepID=A0A0B5EVQ2_STRA4|nr:hypothetical protein SLNWT_2390 [Streptomyces albus]AOU77079.1 hypothetical protein SLNHY_2388 [Streptomyces albus]AYN32858.1 hypothetical protein DUI70_2355 [Streptomyces albus]
MPKTRTSLTPVPATTWLGQGRHPGAEPEVDVRRNLIALKSAGVIDDFLDLDPAEAARPVIGGPHEEPVTAPGALARRLFEARWRVDGDVVVRARLTTYEPGGRRDDQAVSWVLVAEADRAWRLDWPSPATMFWPDSERVPWDREPVAGLRLRATNPLPADDKEMRTLLKECARQSWYIHLVVHEAMTPDAHGQRSLTRFLPPSLRHRVVEHRASPEQFQIVNYAVKDLRVVVPRGGAVVLPTSPPGPEYDTERFGVRSVFLDGSQPTELLAKIIEFAGLPREMSPEAEQAVLSRRRTWHLLTMEEELAHARALVAHYAEALDAMTKSRDLYREAAELARAAMAESGDSRGATAPGPAPGTRPEGSATGRFTKAFARIKDPGKRRPTD